MGGKYYFPQRNKYKDIADFSIEIMETRRKWNDIF